jgi:hypothetical protein
MTSRIVLLSGRPDVLERIVKSRPGLASTVLLPVDEKSIVRVRHMLSLVRAERSAAFCFACKDLEFQRYQFVLKSYLFLSKADQKFMIDETGASIEYSLVRYLFVDLPSFVVELGASLIVVLAAALRIQRLKILVHQGSVRQ